MLEGDGKREGCLCVGVREIVRCCAGLKFVRPGMLIGGEMMFLVIWGSGFKDKLDGNLSIFHNRTEVM